MNIRYRRELDQNTLVIEQDPYGEDYQSAMLTRNRIPGFLECRINRRDQKADFFYDITSRQSLRLVLERRRISYEELLRLLEGLQKGIHQAREYLLDSGTILLSPDYIYLDPDSCRVFLCCFPFYTGNIRADFLELTEYLLERLDRKDQRAVAFGYELYRAAGEENSSLEQILGQQISKEGESYPAVNYETGEINSESSSEKSSREGAGQEQKKYGEGKRAETMILEGPVRQLVLYSSDPAYEDIKVKGDSFVIGKKKDAVDALLKARSVSRLHSRITRVGECYYLTDLNSTNGTYLNGIRLEVNETARIKSGDNVGFAELEFVVGT